MFLRYALGLVLALASLPAAAQDWPTKPIRLIVPFPAGGAVDTLARNIAPKLSDHLGQQILIETRTGAGGSVGTAMAAKSPPDGYTLLFVFDTHAVNPFLMKDLSFDTQKDLAPVSLIATSPLALVANPQVPAASLKELVALATQRPGEIAYASVGAGSLAHLTMTQFQKIAGVQLNHIPYRGGGPAVNDLIGGQVQLFLTTMSTAKPLIEGGKAKALAVTSKERSSGLPDLPTIAEQGYPGFEVTTWFGLLAPAGTPRPIIDRIQADLVKTLNEPDVKERLGGKLALTLVGSGPDEFGRFIDAQMEQWGKVVRENNITAD